MYATELVDSLTTPGMLDVVVTRLEPMPEVIPLLFGDAVHNLRSALDHLARQLVIANNATPRDGPRGTSFVIWTSKPAYLHQRATIEQIIGRRATLVLDGIRPYARGNPNLWQLNALDIIDKHRVPVTAVVWTRRQLRYITLDTGGPAVVAPEYFEQPVRLRKGAVLGQLPRKTGPVTHTVQPFLTIRILERVVAREDRAGILIPRFIKTVTDVVDRFANELGL